MDLIQWQAQKKKELIQVLKGLFKNAKWIITPTQKSDLNSVRTISELIKSMDCEICQASPKEHDEAVSLISHLPIFLASALIETAQTKNNQSLLDLTQKLAATGFADTSVSYTHLTLPTN